MRPQFYSFDKNAAQQIIAAAKIVLNGGDYGATTNSAAQTGLQCITAKLLVKDADNPAYTWQQERRTQTGWEAVTNPLTDSSGKYKAYNVDDFDNTDLSGKHVVLIRIPFKTTDGKNQLAWIFVGGATLPTGQYQHQLFGMNSQNQPGWMFAEAHAIL